MLHREDKPGDTRLLRPRLEISEEFQATTTTTMSLMAKIRNQEGRIKEEPIGRTQAINIFLEKSQILEFLAS